jgi:hypothetical protein
MSKLNRRRFLHGAGTIAIGLPLMASTARFAAAAPGATPPRYISLFFGNGMPKKFVENGYSGSVIAPLAPFQSKLAMVRGLQLNEDGGAQLHYKGTARFGKGMHPPSGSSPGGESLDNKAHRTFAPGSRLLNVNMHTEVTGGNPATRWYHSWRGVNQPNDELLRPLDVFDAIFGSFLPPDPGGLSDEERREIRYRNSVLDSVVDQYRELSSERSPYSVGVRALISDHLDLVRSLERRSVDMEMTTPPVSCDTPAAPPDLTPSQDCTAQLCPGDDNFYYGSGGANWNEVWELNSDLYAMALRCGVTRFGTMGCSGGGDRYPIPELQAQGITESPHVLAHGWKRDDENGFDACVQWLMDKVAYFLAQLDDSAWPDPDGGTVLDNTLVLVGTELGTATDGQHEVDHMTYWLAGGGGRIQNGIFDYAGRSDVDLYSTISRAMSMGDQFGDTGDFSGHLDLVR